MKTINILYWVFTGVFSLFMLGSAIPDIINHPSAIQVMHVEMGYPIYLIPFIGVAKALGVIAIFLPRFSRLKEWAYAGFFFDLIGAAYSLISLGRSDWMFMILPVGLAICSYVFYHRRKRMREAGVAPAYKSNASAGAMLQ